MKILLARPPARVFHQGARPSAGLPLGLLSIAAVLEQDKHEVVLLDGQVDPVSPVSDDQEGILYAGRTWDSMRQSVRSAAPDIIGISSMFTVQAEGALRLAAMAKDLFPDTPVVVGGHDVSVRPAEYLGSLSGADIACIGEGELTMLEIVRARASGADISKIPGVLTRNSRQDGGFTSRPFIADLDSLPLPAYHLIDMEAYFSLYQRGYTDRPAWRYPGSERCVSLITSRGCPFGCIFCSIHLHMGRPWRAHSVDYVLRHLDFLVRHHGARHVHFEDDNLTLDQERFRRLLDGILAAGWPLTWDTPNGVRIDTFTPELLVKSRESGCAYLVFGVESGSPRVLKDVVDKKLDLAAVERVARWCREAKLDTMSFFVVGFPSESVPEMRQTVTFAHRLYDRFGVTPSLFVATPLPGTRLQTATRDAGCAQEVIGVEDLARMTSGAFVMPTDRASAGQIREIIRSFYRGLRLIFLKRLFIFFWMHIRWIFRFLKRCRQEALIGSVRQAVWQLLSMKYCWLREQKG